MTIPLPPPPVAHRLTVQLSSVHGVANVIGHNTWAIYRIDFYDPATVTRTPMYLGMTRLRDVYNFPDAHRNSWFRQLITPTTELFITILYTGEKPDILKQYMHSVRAERLECNTRGINMTAAQRTIRCVETGMVYQSQAEASRMLNISQGHLSMHLQGSPRHRSVGGFTFEFE